MTQNEENNSAPGAAAVTAAAVDVVIPVYRGEAETRRCLESVLAHPQATAFETVVVDDASPEPGVASYLDELAAAGRITLLRNDANIGYVDSANLGCMLHMDRDVVLLNSDTEVNGGWLDRLRACAAGDPAAGTVTPFTNNATICSYPRFLEDNPLPEGMSLAGLDGIFREVNRGRSLEIPTAIGFCMYVTRGCLDRTGYFDSLHFGRGYGEENDFCVRASLAGFKHLLCGDVFVFHAGGASFGAEARRSSDAAQAVLRERHPQYEPAIHAHFAADPERELRRRVDIARLARSPRPRLLMVTHRLGGGTEKFVQDLAGLLEPEYEVLIMRPADSDSVAVEWARNGEEFSAFFAFPRDRALLVDFLKKLRVMRIHFHHTVEVHKLVLDLPADLGLPYDFSVHDYYLVCPMYNLIGDGEGFCGELGVAACNTCLAGHEALAGLDIEEWRAGWKQLLENAERVLVPSRDALARIQRYFPGASCVYMPHPEPPEMFGPAAGGAGEEIKVLVLGELSVAKGARLLEACAADARLRGLPLSFRVLGWAREKIGQEPEIPLQLLGPYEDSRLATLIARERADVIFFPAQWPETYSYTLSAAIGSGVPVAAPRLGAFTERLEDHPQAMLLEWTASPREWNDLFLSVRHSPAYLGNRREP